MTQEEKRVLDGVVERLDVLTAEVEALKTAKYQRLTLDERVRGAKAREPEAAHGH